MPTIQVNESPYNFCAHNSKLPRRVRCKICLQLWRDGKKLGEVIGGHKAHLVVNEVREMIENENSM